MVKVRGRYLTLVIAGPSPVKFGNETLPPNCSDFRFPEFCGFWRSAPPIRTGNQGLCAYAYTHTHTHTTTVELLHIHVN